MCQRLIGFMAAFVKFLERDGDQVLQAGDRRHSLLDEAKLLRLEVVRA